MNNELPAGTYIVKLEVPQKTEKNSGVFIATIIDPIGDDDGRQIKLRLFSKLAEVENGRLQEKSKGSICDSSS